MAILTRWQSDVEASSYDFSVVLSFSRHDYLELKE